MNAANFAPFFRALHGQDPFPWQERLANMLCAGQWPTGIHVPTGCGKTSSLDAFTFALAFHQGRGFPRRLFYVIDRRLVVDDILAHAQDIERSLQAALDQPVLADACVRTVAQRLAALSVEGRPLVACAMRGGGRLELDWAFAPDVPALVVSTVDQVGSRLLFQGYGMSEFARPVHAGLAGCDAAFVLDEAHLSQPFAETLQRVARHSRVAAQPISRPPVVVQVTATPGASGEDVIALSAEDRACAELHRRIARPKLAALRAVPASELPAAAASAASAFLQQPGVEVVGVIVNRVQTARAIFDRLRRDSGAEAFLLIGRIRPVDRERLLSRVLARCHATRPRGQPVSPAVVVATQTIEVGANLDFDALVTESAPLPALKQRFGRLNRLGLRDAAQAVILHAVPDKAVADRADPVYGGDLAEHWKWLAGLEKKLPKSKRKRGQPPAPPPQIDFAAAVFPDLAARAGGEPPATERHAPFLLEAHARLLAHTSPPPQPEPDLSVWLHGLDAGPAEIYVAWRGDFTNANRPRWPELALALPPQTDEFLPLPFGTFRRWLARAPLTTADVEGVRDWVERIRPEAPALRWDADAPQIITAAQARPGDSVILPAALGGSDEFGFAPDSGPVSDVAEVAQAAELVRRRRGGTLALRLHPALLPAELRPEFRALMELLEAGEEVAAPAAQLARQAFAATPHAALREALARLTAETITRVEWYPGDRPEGLLVEWELPTPDASAARARRRTSVLITLGAHSQRVADRAREYASRCGMPEPLQRALELAGLGHDLGKAAPATQRVLRGGEVERAAGSLLAKSLPDAGVLRLPEWRGWRHEALSAALLAGADGAALDGADAELVRWLAGTSHGRGRPLFVSPREWPDEPVTVPFAGVTLSASTRHGLDHLAGGWLELFHRLNDRYGLWGLAWLEAILRLADQQISAEEAE